jgi:hypothetical protein
LFYLGVGAKLAAVIVSLQFGNYAPEKGLASMCIITSVLFLVDTVFAIIGIKNAD